MVTGSRTRTGRFVDLGPATSTASNVVHNRDRDARENPYDGDNDTEKLGRRRTGGGEEDRDGSA